MSVTEGGVRAPSPRSELLIVLVVGWLALAATPLWLGELGISWDALNHQIYLGWSAEGSRFNLDVLPAAYQTYQFPYLYWPLYRLAQGGFAGWQAGAVLAALHLLCIPPLWIITRTCIPELSWFGSFMRLMGLALALMSALVLSLFNSSSNDLLAAIPLLWAFAVVFPGIGSRLPMPHARVLVSGLLGGVAVACKLSNGPLVLLLPLAWVLTAQPWQRRTAALCIGCFAVLLGFLVAYWSWGARLWALHGNPIYPFADELFAPVRAYVGWSQ